MYLEEYIQIIPSSKSFRTRNYVFIQFVVSKTMEKQTIAHSSSIMSNIVTFFCLLFKLAWIDFAQNCLKFRLLLALAFSNY